MSNHPDTPSLVAPDLADTSRVLADWFAAEAPQRVPDGLAQATLTRTAHTRRRAAWRFPGRWLSMTIALRPAALPRASLFLALMVAGALAIGGAMYLASTPPVVPTPLPSASPGPSAVAATNLEGATAVVAGDGHTCAIVAGGRVRCWGLNRAGELGDGTTIDSAVPVEVVGIQGATSIAAGSNTTCVVVAGGEVRCWGSISSDYDNIRTSIAFPELGVATAVLMRANDPCVPRPDGGMFCRKLVDVPGLPGATAVVRDSEGGLTCALLADGRVECWGGLRNGSLGDGSTEYSDTPIVAAGVEGATAIAVGAGLVCAVVPGGNVKCWGHTGISDKDGNDMALLPAEITGVSGATSLTIGYRGACAIVADGHVRCWGANDIGQLGDGTRTNSGSAVEVTGLEGAVALTGGQVGGYDSHTCALTNTGQVRCWGDDTNGQLGGGTKSTALGPVTVKDLSGVTQLSGGGEGADDTCAVLDDGTVRCWGAGQFEEPDGGYLAVRLAPAGVPGIEGATGLTSGDSHTCAIVSGGKVRCWGIGYAGQLGDSSRTSYGGPSDVPGIQGARAIAASSEDTCAALEDGSVWCWGASFFLPGGDPSGNGYISGPVQMPNLEGVTALISGGQHMCAMVAGGRVRCWGFDGNGELGGGASNPDNPVLVPVEVAGLEGATALAAGGEFTCALIADGTVRCWGRNASSTNRTPGDRRGPGQGGRHRRRYRDLGCLAKCLRPDRWWDGSLLGRERLWGAGRWHDDRQCHARGCRRHLRGDRDRRGREPCLRGRGRRAGPVLGFERLRPARRRLGCLQARHRRGR